MFHWRVRYAVNIPYIYYVALIHTNLKHTLLNQFYKNYPPLRKFVLGTSSGSFDVPEKSFEDYDFEFGNPNIHIPGKFKKKQGT